jgi:hypothetical protein
MKFQITSKLELNLMQSGTNPQYATDFAIKNRVPAIVAPPGFIGPLNVQRSIKAGQFKIICTLDFQKGNAFAMDKFRDIDNDFRMADGFEILLCRDRTEIETRNEMKVLYEFLRQIDPGLEIRWCLGMYSRPEAQAIAALKVMKGWPPSYVRTDQHLIIPNVNAERHMAAAKVIRGNENPYPIKVSGNIDLGTIEAIMAGDSNIKRFDVSIDQAVAIVKAADRKVQDERANQIKKANETPIPTHNAPGPAAN